MRIRIIALTAIASLSLAACGNDAPESANQFQEQAITAARAAAKKPVVDCRDRSEVLSHAALRNLQDKFLQYDQFDAERGEVTYAQLDKELSDITKLRQWTDANVTDECTKRAYHSWLDYWESEANEARLVIGKPAAKDTADAYMEERERVYEKAKILSRTLPKPPVMR